MWDEDDNHNHHNFCLIRMLWHLGISRGGPGSRYRPSGVLQASRCITDRCSEMSLWPQRRLSFTGLIIVFNALSACVSINVEATRMAWALSLRNVQCHLEEIRYQHDVLWYWLVCKLLYVARELLRSPSQEESRERKWRAGCIPGCAPCWELLPWQRQFVSGSPVRRHQSWQPGGTERQSHRAR